MEMTRTARLSTKGQIVLPAQARRELHLNPGDLVTVRVEGNQAILKKVDLEAYEDYLAWLDRRKIVSKIRKRDVVKVMRQVRRELNEERAHKK